MAVNGFKLLEMMKMAKICCKWLGSTNNGWKWLDMAENGYNCPERMEMAENDWNLLEMSFKWGRHN